MTPSFWPELRMIGNYWMIVQLQESFNNERKCNDVKREIRELLQTHC